MKESSKETELNAIYASVFRDIKRGRCPTWRGGTTSGTGTGKGSTPAGSLSRCENNPGEIRTRVGGSKALYPYPLDNQERAFSCYCLL